MLIFGSNWQYLGLDVSAFRQHPGFDVLTAFANHQLGFKARVYLVHISHYDVICGYAIHSNSNTLSDSEISKTYKNKINDGLSYTR